MSVLDKLKNAFRVGKRNPNTLSRKRKQKAENSEPMMKSIKSNAESI